MAHLKLGPEKNIMVHEYCDHKELVLISQYEMYFIRRIFKEKSGGVEYVFN